jgi:pectate lyase
VSDESNVNSVQQGKDGRRVGLGGMLVRARRRWSCGCLAAWVFSSTAASALPAFPGAEGFGSDTPAGRGGKVLFVTNTADTGPGSLRAAIDAEGPRIVLFQTGGTIVLQSPLEISNPYITIAGQTAPGDGIQIRNDSEGSRAVDSFPSIRITTHDIVIRFLRIRSGMPELDLDCIQSAEPPKQGHCVEPGDIDTINFEEAANNIVIDHVSASWATDEIIGAGHVRNLSLQWSILSEGLDYMFYGPARPHDGKGMILGNANYAARNVHSGRVSIHHNLWAHNSVRSPQATNSCPDPDRPTDCVTDIVNNVVYDWNTMATHAANFLGHTFVNIVANYYKRGPSTNKRNPGVGIRDWTSTSKAVNPGALLRIYLRGNQELVGEQPQSSAIECYRLGALPDGTQGVLDACDASEYSVAEPFEVAPVKTDDAETAAFTVLSGAGAVSRLDALGRTVDARDAVDRRVVANVRNGTGRILTSPDQFPGWPMLDSGTPPSDRDRDGMPDRWEQLYDLPTATPASLTADQDGDGYTDIEEYLNGSNPRLADTP